MRKVLLFSLFYILRNHVMKRIFAQGNTKEFIKDRQLLRSMSYINKTNKMKPIMDPSINILYTPPYSVKDLRSFPKIKFPSGIYYCYFCCDCVFPNCHLLSSCTYVDMSLDALHTLFHYFSLQYFKVNIIALEQGGEWQKVTAICPESYIQ